MRFTIWATIVSMAEADGAQLPYITPLRNFGDWGARCNIFILSFGITKIVQYLECSEYLVYKPLINPHASIIRSGGRRSRADACLVVTNAQQALTSSDIDLLRLLHGLQKSQLVVFVNCIDQVANPAKDGEAVVAHVCGMLAMEFSGVAIPAGPCASTAPAPRRATSPGPRAYTGSAA
jgi:hypothetical protein